MIPHICLQFVIEVFPVHNHYYCIITMQTPNTGVIEDLLLYLTTALAFATIMIYHHRFTYLSWDPAYDIRHVRIQKVLLGGSPTFFS